MSFQHLGLIPTLLKAIEEQGYLVPTPIQEKAIPAILQGQDVLASAQTGTGKTAGFTLPLLQRLHESQHPIQKTPPVRAVILTPTRELAAQVHENVEAYGRHLSLRAEVIVGGASITMQARSLRKGCDIIVATPGRLIDHVMQKNVNLSQVEILVLDEADRMLDMGFLPAIRQIMAVLPKQRQSLLFSATIPLDIKALAASVLNNPISLEVARQNATADKITERVYGIKKEYKRELLSYLIGSNNWQQVLVFVRTKHGADRLEKQLIQDGLRSMALHGDKTQGARNKALEAFKTGKITVLVATDVAARGLDIDDLPHVVNFDLPQVAEDYIHRIGRTGRAGATGEALSLVSPEEAHLLLEIEKLLKRRIPQVVDTGYEPVSLNVLDMPKKHVTNKTTGKKDVGKKDYRHNKNAPKNKNRAATQRPDKPQKPSRSRARSA